MYNIKILNMPIIISPISQVRQHLPQLVREMQINNQEIIVVSKSKPMMVMVPYATWQKAQNLREAESLEQQLWTTKVKQSFAYDSDEKDNFNPKNLKPLTEFK